MAPGEQHVAVLELRGGRQHHVGAGGGVGHELLEHHHEEVVAAQAFEHALLVGGDRGRVRVPAHERLHRRVELGIGERLAELGHVDRAHRTRAQVLALKRPLAHGRRRGGGDVGAAAATVAPGAGERGQRGQRRVGRRRAEMPLGPDAETQQRGPRGGELPPHARDRLGVDPADRSPVLDRVGADRREQLVVAVGVGAAPLLVGEAGVEDRAHHADAERGVGAGQRAQVLVGHPGGTAAERIDHHDLRARLARVEQLAPEVRSGGHRVPAPDEHVARVRPLLGIDLGRKAVGHHRADDPGRGADRALELAGAERVHQPGAHQVALDQPHGAHVRVGQDRFAPELLACAAQARGHAVECVVPARPAQLSVHAHERVQDALIGVDAVEVVRDLSAQEADRDRMVGIPGDLDRAPVLDGHVHRAGIGTVVRAGAAHDASGHARMVRLRVPGGHAARAPA